MNLQEFLNVWNDLKKEYDANNAYKLPEAEDYLAALSHNINNEKDEASVILMPSYTLSRLAEDENVLKNVNEIFNEWFNTTNLSSNGYQSFDDMENDLIDVCKEWEKETILIDGKETLSDKQDEAKYEMAMMEEGKRKKAVQKEKEKQKEEAELEKRLREKLEAELREKERKEQELYEERQRELEEEKRRALEALEEWKREQKEQEEREKIEREERERREREEREKHEQQEKIEREQSEREQKDRDIDEYLKKYHNETRKTDHAEYDEEIELDFLRDRRKDDAKSKIDPEREEAENLKYEKKLVESVSKEELGKKITSVRDRIWDVAQKGDMGPRQKDILEKFTELSRVYPKECNTDDPLDYYWMHSLMGVTKTGALSIAATDVADFDIKLNQICEFMNEILDDGSFKDMTNFRKRYVEFARGRFELAGGLDINEPDIKESDVKEQDKKEPDIKKEDIEKSNIKDIENSNIEIAEPSALEEALEDFAAIQDRKLGWRMKGSNADKFDAIKASVAEYNDPNSSKSDFEKRKSLYETCENYLRAHTSDGKTIDGQNTEVGRFRKQAVVEILQALEQYPDVGKMKAELEVNALNKQMENGKKPKERVKLSFKDLERSLANNSEAKVGRIDRKDQKTIARKAYAELKAERMAKSKQKEEPKLGRNR